MITTSLSSAWGVEYTRTAKRVWVICERDDGAAPSEAAIDLPSPAQGTHVGVVQISGAGVVTGWNDDATALFGWSPEEVAGRRYDDLLVRATGDGTVGDTAAPPLTGAWQGTYAVACRNGATQAVFASHTRAADASGTVALVVPEALRALLEHPAPATRVLHGGPASFGLREDALVRLSVEEYLTLACERIRDPVSADATYVLLSHDFDDEFEVVAVSGLPEQLLGTRLARGTPGTPDLHSAASPSSSPTWRSTPCRCWRTPGSARWWSCPCSSRARWSARWRRPRAWPTASPTTSRPSCSASPTRSRSPPTGPASRRPSGSAAGGSATSPTRETSWPAPSTRT